MQIIAINKKTSWVVSTVGYPEFDERILNDYYNINVSDQKILYLAIKDMKPVAGCIVGNFNHISPNNKNDILMDYHLIDINRYDSLSDKEKTRGDIIYFIEREVVSDDKLQRPDNI